MLGYTFKAGQSGCSIPVVTLVGLEMGIDTDGYNESAPEYLLEPLLKSIPKNKVVTMGIVSW